MTQKTDPIQVLANLGITRWLHQNPDDNVRSLVNGLAAHLLEDQTIFDYLPLDEDDTERLYWHFQKGYDVDWYSLLTGRFRQDVEVFTPEILEQILTPLDDPSYVSSYVNQYVSSWQQRVRAAFSNALEGHYPD